MHRRIADADGLGAPGHAARYSSLSRDKQAARQTCLRPSSKTANAKRLANHKAFLYRFSRGRNRSEAVSGQLESEKVIKQIKTPETRRIRGFWLSCFGQPISCAYQVHGGRQTSGSCRGGPSKLSHPTVPVARVGPTHRDHSPKPTRRKCSMLSRAATSKSD
jgi:hypothetical protein